MIYGKVQNVVGKGTGAKKVLDILNAEEKENQIYENKKNDIGCMIILDRNIDFLTPMCLQLTYEGIIDEFFSINYNTIVLDSEILNKKDSPNQSHTLLLNNSKKTYKQCRDLSFQNVRQFLQNQSIDYKKVIDAKNKQNQPDV